MSTPTNNQILDMMSELRYEPTRVKGYLMDLMERSFDGEEIFVDPSLPLPFLLESSVVLTCGHIQKDEILSSQQYPNMAKFDEDLYKHMSDRNYEGNFAQPSGAWFSIWLSKNEVIARAAKVGDTTTRKLTIPKHSYVEINGAVFTQQYPINLIVKSHGGIDVVYDGSRPSPLQTLSGNVVQNQNIILPSNINEQQPTEMIELTVWLNQMRMVSYTHSLNASQILKKTQRLTDSYYYTRAFYKDQQGIWQEMKTTHSQQVFDPMDPTLLLRVVEDQLTYELPYVYYATSLVNTDIRVDVYTTKGELTMQLGDFASGSFQTTWRDLDNDDNGRYTAPMNLMTTVSVFSTDMVSGGSAAPTFEERRERMLNNSIGSNVIPISDAQMGTELAEMGFDSTLIIDNVLERVYLATRAVPPGPDSVTRTGIDAAVIKLRSSIEELLQFDTVIDNGERLTITPKTLYRNRDGVLVIVPDSLRLEIDALPADALVNRISDGSWLTTPMHYVLDTTNDRFEVRPYYLSDPTIGTSSYMASNDTTGLTISASVDRSAEIVDGGYRIRIKSSSNEPWKALPDDQVHVQLAFKPLGEDVMAYINGVQIAKGADNERVFEFFIESNWDITPDHRLLTKSLAMFEPGGRDLRVELHRNWSVVWSVSNYSVPGIETSDVDTAVGKFLLPDSAIGVYHEEIDVELGAELSGLWARARAVAGERKALKHAVDVPYVYEANEYYLDVDGLPEIIEVDGVKQLHLKHAKGDPVLNMDGEPTIRYKAGVDVVMDENGNVVYESERNVLRWWDMCLFDAAYRYATTDRDTAYFRSVPNMMVDWINDSLKQLRERCIERTDLLFQPRNTLKIVDVLVDDGEGKSINAAQRLSIDLYVTKEVYDDAELRAVLEESAIDECIRGLDNIVVAKANLQDSIKAILGDDVITVGVSGLGGINNDYDVITLLDESSRLCVLKSLVSKADGKIGVEDAVEVNFRRHAQRNA